MILKFVGHSGNQGEVKEVFSDVTYYKTFMLEDCLNVQFSQSRGDKDQIKMVDKVLFVMNDSGQTIDKVWGYDPNAEVVHLEGFPSVESLRLKPADKEALGLHK